MNGVHYAFDTPGFEDDARPEREAHVQVELSRSVVDRLTGRGGLAGDDAVVGTVRAILETCPEAARLRTDQATGCR